jgi:hypothetical protein
MPSYCLRWGLANFLQGLALNHDPFNLSLQVGRINGISHQCLKKKEKRVNVTGG